MSFAARYTSFQVGTCGMPLFIYSTRRTASVDSLPNAICYKLLQCSVPGLRATTTRTLSTDPALPMRYHKCALWYRHLVSLVMRWCPPGGRPTFNLSPCRVSRAEQDRPLARGGKGGLRMRS